MHVNIGFMEKGGNLVNHYSDKEQRIAQIYDCYYLDVYRFIMCFTGHKSEANDLTQETFIIHQREELRVAMFGFSIPFAQQDLMEPYGEYIVKYPYKFTISFGMLENTSSIYFCEFPFVFSVIIVYVGLSI